METKTAKTFNSPDFIRHIFDLVHSTKTTKVYELREVRNGNATLTQTVRIEDYNGKSNATVIKEYFRLRNTKNWNTSEKVTGLRKSKIERLYYGDRLYFGKKNLITFYFNHDRTKMCVDYYRSFYPNTPTILHDILDRKIKKK